MMYLGVYPVTMAIRNTNVYEERSLGIFAEDLPQSQEIDNSAQDEKKEGPFPALKRAMSIAHTGYSQQPNSWKRQDFVRQQLRGQLGHDLWVLGLAVFIVTCIETGQFDRDPVVFSTFNIIFEIVSAYGCVGISTGVPLNAYSFCGAWHTAS